ncbi:hypothetical protein [Halalkalicoccus tibetensis]|uniref:Uncharacterized protein n=1 Tax=Halalkalicoccus tibetensis TaxID=175632 RepID=A0ABD5VBI9_9EURY
MLQIGIFGIGLLELGIGIIGTVFGYIIGVIKPVMKDEYQTDRKWCRRLHERYEELDEALEELNMYEEEEESSPILDDIFQCVDELEEHIEGEYPNYRREERQRAREIVTDGRDIVAHLHFTEPEQHKREKEIELREQAEKTNENARNLRKKIESTDEDLSYGAVYYAQEVLTGRRAL